MINPFHGKQKTASKRDARTAVCFESSCHHVYLGGVATPLIPMDSHRVLKNKIL
jgi:hypothetical protein